jgi:hypothetical protein
MASTAAAKTAAKKAAPRKTASIKRSAPAVADDDNKVALPRKKRVSAKHVAAPSIRPEERHHLIEVAAYYIAEQRGFHGASSHDDWIQAEREVDAMILSGKFADRSTF